MNELGGPAAPARLSSQAIEPHMMPCVSPLRASILAATATATSMACAAPSRKSPLDRAAHKAVLCNATASPSRWLRKAGEAGPALWHWKPLLLPFTFSVIALRSRQVRPGLGSRLKAQAVAPAGGAFAAYPHRAKGRPVPVFHDPETPSVTPACNRLNAQPWPPFLRRLRRAEHHRKGEQPWQQKQPAPQITTQGVPPAPPRLTKGQIFKTNRKEKS